MARRRRRTTKSPLSYFDWSVSPDTIREVVAVALFVTGVVGGLAIFNLAGSVGVNLTGFFKRLIGVIHVFLPLMLLSLGAFLWNPTRFLPRWTLVLGVAGFFLFLPGLVSPFGGVLGTAVNSVFTSMIGEIATIIVLVALTMVSLLLVFNTSIRGLLELLAGAGEPQINDATATPRVSVFESLRQRLAGRRNDQVPVTTMPAVSPSVGKPVFGLQIGDWQLPPLDLLSLPTGRATPGNVAKNVETIEKTLKDFGITVAMGDVNIGPTVTQYTLKPADGVKLTAITARASDLALALAAPAIRVEAPIPGKALVGVEVPNKVPATVTLREVLETEQFKGVKSNLTLGLGRDAAGTAIAVDLKKMPHLLIAGATGSGKSIAINALITALLYENSPKDLRLILVDPKRVEFTPYNDVPHLLTPVVTEPDRTVNTLKWALVEMERRYHKLQEVGSRDIGSYNAKFKAEPLPYIVILIDELADLMAQSAKEVEGSIVRIAQLARAVGIHLIVATQRPSVDVITGLIKANITTRMAFSVASQVDSRTILDVAGADKLLGNGDMLFLSAELTGKPKRVQGCLITEKEVEAVTDFLKDQAPAQYDQEVMEFNPRGSGGPGGVGSGEVDDTLYDEAKTLVIQAGKASASLLQRRLRVGYARAARLLDLLEQNGAIGPADGARPRDVLVGLDSVGGAYQSSVHPGGTYPTSPPHRGGYGSPPQPPPRPPHNPNQF